MEEMFNKNVRTGEFPPFYPFAAIDDSVMGRVIGQHESQFSTEQNKQTVYHILTPQGEEYCLPTSTVAMQLYETTKMKEGDYIKMVYKGTTMSKNKRNVKSYTLAVIEAETFEKNFPDKKIPMKVVKKPAKREKTETPAQPAAQPAAPASPAAVQAPADEMSANVTKDYNAMKATGVLNDFQIVQALKTKYNMPIEDLKKLLAPKPAPAPVAAAPAGVPPDEVPKLKTFIGEVLAFYDKIDKKDLPELLKTGNFVATADQAIEVCKDLITVDSAGFITKKA